MKLGEFLKAYRARNNLTMQDLADACGFSKAYINMLEKGVNPTTGKPVSPTIQTFEKIAKGTGMDIDSLLKLLDGDQPITINPLVSLSDEQTMLLKGFESLNTTGRNLLIGVLESLSLSHSKGEGSNVVQVNNGGTNFLTTGGNNSYNIVAEQ